MINQREDRAAANENQCVDRVAAKATEGPFPQTNERMSTVHLHADRTLAILT